MTKIKAVIFDMDGVLIDAREWHYEALNRALRLFGMDINRYDHLVTYDGLPTKKKLEMISLEHGLSRKLHNFINKMKQIYTLEIVYSKCKPVFQHQYALAQLKQEGYLLAVGSNSVRLTVQTMLQQSKLIDYFEFCLSNQDVRLPKPDPELYLKAIELLNVTAAECLIVEDNEHGVKAAIASGAHVLKVANVEEVTYQNIKDKIIAQEYQG
jgi:beta-phosphoglucomutase